MRSYDPALKRFLQPDPSLQEGVRSYVYVGDEPVDGTDPSGLLGFNCAQPPCHFGHNGQGGISGVALAVAAVIGAVVVVAGAIWLALNSPGDNPDEDVPPPDLPVGPKTAPPNPGTAVDAQLEAAAESDGPTERFVTALDQAPQVGRRLSTATGDNARALAQAAGQGRQLYVADIPKALLDRLVAKHLAREVITNMGGVTGTEWQFSIEASRYVVRFFKLE